MHGGPDIISRSPISTSSVVNCTDSALTGLSPAKFVKDVTNLYLVPPNKLPTVTTLFAVTVES